MHPVAEFSAARGRHACVHRVLGAPTLAAFSASGRGAPRGPARL